MTLAFVQPFYLWDAQVRVTNSQVPDTHKCFPWPLQALARVWELVGFLNESPTEKAFMAPYAEIRTRLQERAAPFGLDVAGWGPDILKAEGFRAWVMFLSLANGTSQALTSHADHGALGYAFPVCGV